MYIQGPDSEEARHKLTFAVLFASVTVILNVLWIPQPSVIISTVSLSSCGAFVRVVTLNTPENDTYETISSFDFNFTPVDENLANCSLYGNFNSTWMVNQTNTTPTSFRPTLDSDWMYSEVE